MALQTNVQVSDVLLHAPYIFTKLLNKFPLFILHCNTNDIRHRKFGWPLSGIIEIDILESKGIGISGVICSVLHEVRCKFKNLLTSSWETWLTTLLLDYYLFTSVTANVSLVKHWKEPRTQTCQLPITYWKQITRNQLIIRCGAQTAICNLLF